MIKLAALCKHGYYSRHLEPNSSGVTATYRTCEGGHEASPAEIEDAYHEILADKAFDEFEKRVVVSLEDRLGRT